MSSATRSGPAASSISAKTRGRSAAPAAPPSPRPPRRPPAERKKRTHPPTPSPPNCRRSWRSVPRIACNWKVFWENFSECYHCPGVHPELTRLVPMFSRAIVNPYDDPDWPARRDDPHPRFQGGLREGAQTWSMDGRTGAKPFPNLSDDDRRAGQRYMTLWPTMFMVAHIDYARIVAVRALGPEETQLDVEWLFPEETLADPAFDMKNCIDFAQLVVDQDGAACELNQKGLRS